MFFCKYEFLLSGFNVITESYDNFMLNFFWRATILFSTVTLPLSVLTNSVHGSDFSTFLLILVIFWFKKKNILMGIKLCIIVVWFAFFSPPPYICMYVYVYIFPYPSLEKCLFKSLPHFELDCFLLFWDIKFFIYFGH